MASLFTNLVRKVVISRKWTENGLMLDREWTDEVAEKRVRMSTVWAMMQVNFVKLVNFVMQFFKWTKWTKWTAQIFVESAESAKSAKPIFATFATFASANFVGKASCESTVRYREWSRIPSYLFRYSLDSILSRFSLASLICLCMLTVGVGEVWGADYTYSLKIDYRDFNTTSYAANNNEKTSTATCTTDPKKTMSVKWTSNQVMRNSTNMQWQKKNGYIYNSTDLGTINSVTVTSSAGSFTKYYGTSEHPTSGTTVGNGFFTVKVGDKTGTTSQIVINFTISEGGGTPTCATPTFSPAAGSYIGTQSVTISSTTTGSTIYYTTDGSTPTTGSAHGTAGAASATVSVSSNQTLKAYAVKDGANDSEVATAAYTIISCSGDEFSWNLGTNSYDANPTTELIKWTGTYATMQNEKNTSSTNVTNYIPTSQASTRFYSNQKLTITPASGVTISHVVFTATTTSYAGVLRSSTWTNATASGSDTYVIVTPTDGTTAFSAAVGGTCGFTNVNVCYNACTPLGTINGSVSWSNPTTAVLTWDNIDNVDSWTAKWKTGAGSYATTNVSAITTNGAGKKTCTVTGLSCNTSYDFIIIATPDDGYCDKEEELTNKNSGKWDLDYTFSGVSLKDGDQDEGTGVLCGDLVITIEPLSVAYELPSDVTVTIGGNEKTIDEDYLWDSSTGELYIDGSTIDGDVTVSCTATLVGCLADPSIGAVSLKTGDTFNLGQVDVTVATSGTGSATCAWTDYGFVWSESANPTVGGSGCTKVAVGSDGSATTWNGSLTKTSFATGTTYYYRAYGKNSKTSAAFAYSSSDGTFKPQSVTFNKANGEDNVVTYVNYNTAVGEPSDPSKTGYSFAEWQLSGSTYNFSNGVTSNITLTATWNANTYLVTLKKNGGSGDDQVVRATYDATMPLVTTADGTPAITVHTKNGYTLLGYWDATSDGNQYYSYNAGTSTLSSFRTWNKTAATDLYARWQANQYTVTLDANGGVDGATTSVNTTFGQAMPTIAAANLPTREGYRFDGFYTEKSGGTQYYNANGTSAKNQARYSANQKLYAHWVAQLKFSVNGAIDGTLTRDDNTAMPSTAAVPTACGDCWAFMGWSTDPDEDGAPEYAGGATHEFGGPTTLYAVFGKTEYKMINSTSGLVENDNYVVTFYYDDTDHEYALSNEKKYTHDAGVTDVTSLVRENGEGWFIYNVGTNNIWKFTGTSSSGQLYNAASGKYVNLSSTSSDLLNTTNNLTFTNDGIFWIIKSTNYLKPYSYTSFEINSSKPTYSCFLYHQISSTVATIPSCETYDIVWKVEGTPLNSGSQTEETTTCTGIETLPTSPDNDELNCANVFMGWSEKELVGAGHDEPDDLFLTIGYAPKIDEDKTFHAVFATAAPITNKYVLGTVDDLKDGQKVILVNHANSVACTSTAGATTGTLTKVDISSSFSNDTLVTSESSIVWTVTKSGDYYVFKSGDNYLYCSGESSLFCGATSDKWTISSGSVDGTYYLTSYNQSSYKFEYYSKNSNFTTYGGTGTAYNTDFYVPALSYSDYQTICCDNSITIGSPSITGSGTVTFAVGGSDLDPGDEVETCTSAKDVVATVTPAAGYNCTAVSFSGGSVSVDPTPGAGNYPSAPSSQNYTLSFAKETTAATLSTSATFTAKALTAWAWKYKKDADAADGSVAPYDIPDVVDLYIGQYARFIITGYSPSDVIADKQGFVYVSSDDPAVMQPVLDKAKITYVSKDANNTYYQVKGKAATESTTITIKATGDGSITKTVTIRVKALPTVTFEDLIHNKTDFANRGDGWTAGTGVLSSTASNVGVVSHTKKTPTHADVAAPGTGNDCEKGHLHLMGWIRSDYPALVAYMNGTGVRPEYSAIISAGDDDSDKAYFLAPNASINVEDFNGKTFYAVWATIE